MGLPNIAGGAVEVVDFTDDWDSEKAASATPRPNAENYRLERSPDQLSGWDIFSTWGDDAWTRVRNREAPQADYGEANNIYSYAGGTIDQGVQALGADAVAAGDQRALSAQLQARAAGTAGPSLAEMSMQRQADDIAAQNLSLAASGTGPSNTAALINAQNRNAMAGGQLVRDMGIQRSAEQQAAEAALAQNLSAERGGTNALAASYGNLGGQQAGIAGARQDQANFNADMQLQNRAQNDAQENWMTQFGYNAYQYDADAAQQFDTNHGNWQIGAASNKIAAQQGASGTSAGIMGMAGGLLAMSDVNAKKNVAPAGDTGQWIEYAKQRNAAGKSGDQKQAMAAAGAAIGSYLGASGQGQGAPQAQAQSAGQYQGLTESYKRLSELDAQAKSYDGVEKPSFLQQLGGSVSGDTSRMQRWNAAEAARGRRDDAARGAWDQYRKARFDYDNQDLLYQGGNPYSDVRAKKNVDPKQPDIGDTFRALGSYGYDYKDPQKHGEGRFYGPMAQELAVTPAGRTAVMAARDGTLAIDPDRLAVMNASETGNLRRDVDDLSAKLDAIGETRANEIYATGNAVYPDEFAEPNPYGRVAPTDLIYDQRSDMFRTPEHQMTYSLALQKANKPRVRPEDRLFVSQDESTMRTPLEQYDYQAAELARLREQNDRDAAILAALGRSERDTRTALAQPTTYPRGY